MDAGMADRLAASMDPKALGTLQNHNTDPAVARAVAAQFGSFLMQGMMQGADGTAMSVADGTGGATVSAMFASAMGRYAMSGDKLGLADAIYRSMAAKGGLDAAPTPTTATTPAATPAPAETKSTKPTTPVTGLPLEPYRQERGHRPLGSPVGNMTQPAGIKGLSKALGSTGGTKHDLVAAATMTVPAKTISPAVQSSAIVAATPAMLATQPAPPHPEVRAHWAGMSLPRQVNVLLPPAETIPSVPMTAPATSDADTRTPPPATASAVVGDAKEPIPYGLPWTHHKGGTETGAAGQHHAAAAGTQLAAAENFAEELAPSLQQAGAKLGVSPRVLLAQAALETGWGHSVVGNNIFGIKAGNSWSGATVTAPTHEMEGGHLVAHQATFRSYPTVGQAVEDYVALVSASNRYRSAVGSGDNVTAYGQALAAGGYASDRDYAAKLAAVANSSRMNYAVASLDDAAPGQLVSAHG